jgi:hypothetical protein
MSASMILAVIAMTLGVINLLMFVVVGGYCFVKNKPLPLGMIAAQCMLLALQIISYFIAIQI